MKLLIPILMMGLVIACGDDDAGPAQLQPNSAAGGSEASADGDAENSKQGAVVTIGTETFEFESLDQCVTIGGQISGGASLTDAEVHLSFTIPPEDWETNERFNNPPSISIEDRRSVPNVQWYARSDGSLPPDAANQVDSYTIEGRHTSGEVTFRSQSITGGVSIESETAPGTFEIDCGG